MTPVGHWRPAAGAAEPIRELVARAAAVDGVAALSGHVLDALAGDAVAVLTVPQTAGSTDGDQAPLLAVAAAMGSDPAEVVVDPGARGRGVGTELVRAAVQRQRGVWAYGDLPPARSLAAGLGLQRVRELLQMRRPLGPVPDAAEGPPVLPAGVTVRTFVPGVDDAAFLAVNARAFAWHPEQGRLDGAGLRAEMAQDWFDPGGFFLAVEADSGRVLGFHWTKLHPADPNPGIGVTGGPIGEVYVLGVDPAAGRRGLGTPLTQIGLAHLRARGVPSVMLYVEGDNDRAVRLYQRLGFRTCLTNAVYAATG